MRQLLSKEVLYEPMKEIGERYPEWLESNKSELSKEDLARYTRQHEFIKQLCQVYETTPNDFQRVVDLMQNMQDCGQPPPDIVRELAPGLELGEDGLPVYVLSLSPTVCKYSSFCSEGIICKIVLSMNN